MEKGAALDQGRRSLLNTLIRENLKTTKIVIGQLDPNGLCNAKCWYCPVKYEGNPEEYNVQLPIEDLDKILGRIREATVVDQQKFGFIYTAHYNEILLYKHFKELPAVFRKHRLRTMVLSNGTPLVPQKIDVIVDNPDVLDGICLNIPDIDPDEWAKKSGFSSNLHPALMRNLDYLHEKKKTGVSIQVNTMTSQTDLKSDGIFTPKEEALEIVSKFKARFPSFNTFLVEGLVDRSGSLDKHGVIKNQSAIMLPNKRVIGCSHSYDQGSRIYGWVHVNAVGDVFLCCDDYKMDYKFGNLLEKSLDEIWLSEEHVNTINRAFQSLCRGCVHHISS